MEKNPSWNDAGTNQHIGKEQNLENRTKKKKRKKFINKQE